MYSTFIDVIKTIATISSVLMFLVIAYFAQSLNMEKQEDKAAMYGFCWMMITIMINIVCMWI
jgi:phage shock protein PspC (stress-responsive transcriptional regulator)